MTDYLENLPIGTMFRTAKWKDIGSTPNCSYQRCHCVYRVTSDTQKAKAQGGYTYVRFRDVEVVKRCDSKTRMHEDTCRPYKYQRRGQPLGTVLSFVYVVPLDPLAYELEESFGAY